MYSDNRIADLLPVCTDILNRCRADKSGNPGQAFDTCKVIVDATLHEVIPMFSGTRNDIYLIAIFAQLHATKIDPQHKPVESPVRKNNVAPTSEYLHTQALLFGVCQGVADLVDRGA
jgi:hypothetical protein